MAFKVGAKVDGYEFLRLLGSAGAAVIYEVNNHNRGRREMLKLLPRELLSNEEGVHRFEREMKVRSQLSHPRIADFYEVVVLDGQPAMTMEMVAGSSLEKVLAEGPITMGEAADIATSVLEALEYAHEREVVHREVSPNNIYVSPEGNVKLTGFGLAKQYSDPRLTAPGLLVGQVHYLSPEQVKGLPEIDGRSDVYSLGVVLFEMLTGQRPFDSKSQFDIIQAHVLEAPPLPTDLREDLPKQLEQVVLQSLEKFPADRFADAREFRHALLEARSIVRALETREKPFQVRDPIDDFEEEAPTGSIELPPALREAIDRRRRKTAGGEAEGLAAPGAGPAAPAPTLAGALGEAADAAPDAAPEQHSQNLLMAALVTLVVVAAVVLCMLTLTG